MSNLLNEPSLRKQALEAISYFSEERVKQVQALNIFTSFSMNLVKRDSYYYYDSLKKESYKIYEMLYKIIDDNDDFITRDNVDADIYNSDVYQVYDLPMLTRGNNDPVWVKTLDDCVKEGYIDSFLMTNEVYEVTEEGKKNLVSSRVIPWTKVIVIKNYRYNYFVIKDLNKQFFGVLSNVRCLKINSKIRYRHKSTMTDIPIECGFMFTVDGAYTTNPEDAEFGVDLNYKGNSTSIVESSIYTGGTTNEELKGLKGISESINMRPTVYRKDEYRRVGFTDEPWKWLYLAVDTVAPVGNFVIITSNNDVLIDPTNYIESDVENLFLFKKGEDAYDNIIYPNMKEKDNKLMISSLHLFFDSNGATPYTRSLRYMPLKNRLQYIFYMIEGRNDYKLFKNVLGLPMPSMLNHTGIGEDETPVEEGLETRIEDFDKRIINDMVDYIADIHNQHFYSSTLSGAKIKSSLTDDPENRIYMSRSYWRDFENPYDIHGFCYVMIFHNDKLYSKYNTIHYDRNFFSFVIDKDSIKDDDTFEFIYICNAFDFTSNLKYNENGLYNYAEKTSTGFTFKSSKKYDINKCNFFIEDIPNNGKVSEYSASAIANSNDDSFIAFDDIDRLSDEKFIHKIDVNNSKKFAEEKVNNSVTKYSVVINQENPEYAKYTASLLGIGTKITSSVTVVPREQFGYFRYEWDKYYNKNYDGSETEKDLACKLPVEFKYFVNVNQYMVFVNGQRLMNQDLLLAVPDFNNPYSELVLYISYPFTKDDKIDIFYLPFEIEDFDDFVRNDDIGSNDVILLSDHIKDFDNKHIGYNYINNSNSFIFYDGCKFNPKDIEFKGSNMFKIKSSEKRNNITVAFIHSIGEDIQEVSPDSWIRSLTEENSKCMESGKTNILYELFDNKNDDWSDSKLRNMSNDVSDSFEASTYERMGIVVQAYKDYYETYIMGDANKIIPYVGDAINYSYQEGDADKGLSRIYDANANIYPDV